MRDAVKLLGGDPEKINPICPADLVIDHSIQVDFNRRWGTVEDLALVEINVIAIYDFIWNVYTPLLFARTPEVANNSSKNSKI